MEYTKFGRISLQHHHELNERWVQDRIAEDPSMLGLGDVVLKDKERATASRRLDLICCSRMLMEMVATKSKFNWGAATKAISSEPSNTGTLSESDTHSTTIPP